MDPSIGYIIGNLIPIVVILLIVGLAVLVQEVRRKRVSVLMFVALCIIFAGLGIIATTRGNLWQLGVSGVGFGAFLIAADIRMRKGVEREYGQSGSRESTTKRIR